MESVAAFTNRSSSRCIRKLCPANPLLQVAGILANSYAGATGDSGRGRTNIHGGELAQYDSTVTHGTARRTRARLAIRGWSGEMRRTNEQGAFSRAGWSRTTCGRDGSQEVAHPPITRRGHSHVVRGVLKRQGASNESARVDGASGAGTRQWSSDRNG
jgi:hypothetical protein